MSATLPMHAHVSKESQDCDGRYSRSYVIVPTDGQDDYAFQAMVVGMYMPFDYRHEPVSVEFTSDGFSFSEPTEEGFEATEVEWCSHNDTNERGTFRDHSAEAAGY